MQGRKRCDQTQAWSRLQELGKAKGRNFDLRGAFAADPQRFQKFSLQAPQIFADLSKNLWDEEIRAVLLDLARECGLEAQRAAMFAGEHINRTEDRAVMHWLLRHPETAGDLPANLHGTLGEVHATLTAMLAFAEQVRKDDAITDVVNLGVGGSDLGPRMAVQALDAHASHGKRYHFVSNIDGHELEAVLRELKPESTLFIVASKTFTTAETMSNARTARTWFERQGGKNCARHFVAVTANPQAAKEFGVGAIFGFWDWVGGRYSLWSALGLSLAIAIGAENFRALLAGAHAMDQHFLQAPLPQNLPVQLALLGIWNRNFLGCTSRSIAPYHQGLARFPAYIQQLEMESNGKRVDMDGEALPYATSPVIWGEAGTNGQHSFFQLLHQGSDVVPVEFIAVRQAAHDLPGHHDKLLANALAQARTLLVGRDDGNPHHYMPGNRPSYFFVLDALTPESLGALIALHEHRVFVAGALWGINSFDQFGVELGKVIAGDILPRLHSGDASGLDGSTAGLLRKLRR